MKNGQVLSATLENVDGSQDKTVIVLLSPVAINGTATVKVVSDQGNLAGVRLGAVLRGFHVTNGVLDFA